MWSISYSLPEAWTCYANREACDFKEAAGLHGYDPYIYLRRANVMLSKLALLGVREGGREEGRKGAHE